MPSVASAGRMVSLSRAYCSAMMLSTSSADEGVQRRRGEAVGGHREAAQAHLLLDAGDADLEELVEVARHDAQEAQPLEQRHGRIGGLGEHAALELQQESSRLMK